MSRKTAFFEKSHDSIGYSYFTKSMKIFCIMTVAAIVTNTAHAAARVYKNLYTDNNAMVVEVPDIDKSATGKFYIGARFDYTLANFTNKYSFESDPSYVETDSFSFKPQLGFDVSAGYQVAPKWRVELGYGYTGKFEDKDANMSYDIGAQYLTVNGLYTITEWDVNSVYIGAGLGAGYLTTRFGAAGLFDPAAKTEKSSLGLAGSLQLGIEREISDDVRVGLSYKLGYLTGHTQKITDNTGDVFVSKTAGVLSNTFGLGLRFVF